MQPLYELTADYQAALLNLHELLEAGEIDQNTFNDTAEGIQGEVKDKCVNVALYIKNLEADVARYKDAEKSFKGRRERAEKAIEFFTNYLATNMQKANIPEINDQFVDVKWKKLPDVVELTGPVPPLFERVKEERAPDKKMIGDYLKAGCTFLFARMQKDRKKLVVE